MSSSNSNSNTPSLGMADNYHVNIGPAGLEKDTRRGVFLDTTHTVYLSSPSIIFKRSNVKLIDGWDIVTPSEEEMQFLIEQFNEGKGDQPYWERGRDRMKILGVISEALGSSVIG